MQGQGAKSPYEDIILFLIIVGLIIGVAMAIWYYAHVDLSNLLRWIRVGELRVLIWWKGPDYPLPVAGLERAYTASEWMKSLSALTKQQITTDQLRLSTLAVVPHLRPIFVSIIIIFGFWAALRGPNTRYRRKLDLEGLIREQAKSFPAIAPFAKFDPRKMPFRVVGQAVPDELPLFAEALSPEEWIAYHEIEVRGNQIDAGRTYEALAEQLGPRWEGPLSLPPHAQGLYAAFALRHARKRKESEALLGEMSLCWTPEKGLRLGLALQRKITKLIKDPKIGGAIKPYADMHAYATTALLRCLQRARQEGGVLAPALFLWLRGVDRNLWYPLNNLGRHSYHPEAVGALVHFTNELVAGQKIPSPRFDDVIKGIQDAVTGPQGRPIPPLEKKGKK